MASFILQLGEAKLPKSIPDMPGNSLRLLSVDALMRKLRFDFRDTFGEGFYFDSIRSTAWILKTALCTPTTRWWMAWKRTSL